MSNSVLISSYGAPLGQRVSFGVLHRLLAHVHNGACRTMLNCTVCIHTMMGIINMYIVYVQVKRFVNELISKLYVHQYMYIYIYTCIYTYTVYVLELLIHILYIMYIQCTYCMNKQIKQTTSLVF